MSGSVQTGSPGAPGVTQQMRDDCTAEKYAEMQQAADDYHAGKITLFEMDQRMAMALVGYAMCLSRKVAEEAVKAVEAIAVTIDGTIYQLTGHHAGDIIVIGLTIYVIFQLIPLLLVPVAVLA